MAGQTLDTDALLQKDDLACQLAARDLEWQGLRADWVAEQKELRAYLYATDTTKTMNSKLPWKHKTTLPKLTQIMDNLFANYILALFPRRLWLSWLADNSDAADVEKQKTILAYMRWVTSQPMFKTEIAKCVMDFIQAGNAIGTVEWVDQRKKLKDKIQSGYVGPVVRRIAPIDTTFNPIAPSFYETGKFIRSYMTLGELKKKLNSMSTDENREEYEKLFKYLVEYRQAAGNVATTEFSVKDDFLRVDGFDSFHSYLKSDYVEILTYYGDVYDRENDELLENHVIMIADRHKLISKKPNPSYFGYPPIFHSGWRVRQDNLWAMSPLTNLVGLQYQIDHVENNKADVRDLIAFPLLKIKGQVQDFEWRPMERIYTDADSDVEMIAPPFQVLQLDSQVDMYGNYMEAFSGSPREAMGFRTPGEKTATEVTKLENAAARIFQAKIMQFEEQFLEPILNAMLEMAQRMIQGAQDINVFDDEFNIQTFLTLSADDITGAGRIKPVGARHFAEKAQMVQNLMAFAQSGLGQDPMVQQHFSSIKVARMIEDLLDLKEYELVQENIRISEQQKAQQLANVGQEQTEMMIQTPAGIEPDDVEMQGMPAV